MFKLGLSSLILVTFLLVGVMTVPASAHVLKTDGEIAAILHINPNDAPTSGSPSSLIFFVSDTTSRFTLSNCICRATIQENGRTISTINLTALFPGLSQNNYVFPNPDVYTVQLNGDPKISGDFQPFTLTYIVRVDPGVNATTNKHKPTTTLLWTGVGSTMSSVVCVALYQESKYRHRHKSKK